MHMYISLRRDEAEMPLRRREDHSILQPHPGYPQHFRLEEVLSSTVTRKLQPLLDIQTIRLVSRASTRNTLGHPETQSAPSSDD
jgi:hypothetical protein